MTTSKRAPLTVIKIARSRKTQFGATYFAVVDGKSVASWFSSDDDFGRSDLKNHAKIYDELFPVGYEYDFDFIEIWDGGE